MHVIGAGLAGLAAAVRLAACGEAITLYEAAPQAGGRCRSYQDPTLDLLIDNGNHLLLSGNQEALSYLAAIGAQNRVMGPPRAEFPFVDLKTAQRWQILINDGRLPFWIFFEKTRVPGSSATDYFEGGKLLFGAEGKTVGEILDRHRPLYEKLWRPFFVAALNTDLTEASAKLAAAIMRGTLLKGGRACRPLIARKSLAYAFIVPALLFLKQHKAEINLSSRARALSFEGTLIRAIDFGDRLVEVAADDRVILAVPPWVASALIPGLVTPTEYRAIVNAHFRHQPAIGTAPMIGIINGLSEWIFAFEDHISVTISAADRLLETSREELAKQIWGEIQLAMRIAEPLPAWQIVKEKRATFVATPEQDMRRPEARTQWTNLVLAGDWTATGLPATIEGSIASGHKAAELSR